MDDAEVQTRAVVLTPLPGTLVIESIPPSATVSLSGTAIGVTPLTIDEVDAGAVTVNLVATKFTVTAPASTSSMVNGVTPIAVPLKDTVADGGMDSITNVPGRGVNTTARVCTSASSTRKDPV